MGQDKKTQGKKLKLKKDRLRKLNPGSLEQVKGALTTIAWCNHGTISAFQCQTKTE